MKMNMIRVSILKHQKKSVTGGPIDRLTDGRDQSTSRLTVPAGGSDNNQVCIYTHNYDVLRTITLLQYMLVHILLHIIISSGPSYMYTVLL